MRLKFREYGLPLLLLAASAVSTTASGARFMQNFVERMPPVVRESDLWPWSWLQNHPQLFKTGWIFSASLLGILLVHEFGHYIACRWHGIRSTLPWVLPAPTLSGTVGAVIQIRSRIPNRNALMDVGIYGPLAGFAASAIAVCVGFALSHHAHAIGPEVVIRFGGEPLTVRMLHALMAHWNPTLPSFHRISPHPVKSIAFDPVHDGRVLFASTNGGILVSADEGRTVRESDSGFSNRTFTTLAGAGKVLYASSADESGGRGLWRSEDSGVTWQPVAGAGIKGSVLVLTASPNHAGTLYAAGYREIWKSIDGGRKWIEVPGPRGAGRIAGLLDLPSGEVLAGTDTGLYRQSGKAPWNPVLLGGGASRVESLQRSGEKDVAAITSAGAFLSHDIAQSWKTCGALPGGASWYGLAVDSHADNVALAATSMGLFRSTDRCASWTPVREGLDGGTVSQILFHPTEPGVVFASQYGRLVRSADSGAHWQPVDFGGRHRFWPSRLLILPAAPEHLFALLPRRGVLTCSIGPDVDSVHGSSGR